MKISLIGCGRIFQKHIEAIKNNSFFKLDSLCEINQSKHNDLKKKYNLPVYSNISDFLNNCNSQVISICSPSGLHAKQAIECANAGFDVICEKPMATKLEDANEIVKNFTKNKRNIFIVKQNRLNPTIKKLKNALVERTLGQIFMINVNVFWCRPQSYYDQDEWRGTWELDGGALMNQASHYVDLLDWLNGSIEHVHCFSSTLKRKIEVEDTAVVNLKWKSGTLGSLNVTMLANNKNYEGSITILGEKGIIKISGQALNEVETWFIEGKDYKDELKTNSYQIENIYGNGHQYYYEEIEKFYREQPYNLPSGKEGLKSLELLIAFYKSSVENRSIKLPL